MILLSCCYSFAVPEYDVVVPYESDENGHPLPEQRVQQRSLERRDNIFYKVPVFGKELRLNLTLNRKLMSPNLVMETRHADGTVLYSSAPTNTLYLGHVMSDPYSMVAVSNDEGLVCMHEFHFIARNLRSFTKKVIFVLG